jgi:hypothetical protein
MGGSVCLVCDAGFTAFSGSARCSDIAQPVIRHATVDGQTPGVINGTSRRLFQFTSVEGKNAIMFARNTSCRVLVVAGGGGGGMALGGGGAGTPGGSDSSV